jgi:CxC2 like cysteine cluster associated with KDZ transposases
MWNGTFFERSDLLTHELTIDLCHFPDDCHSIPLNLETHTIFYPDSPDEADEFTDGHFPDGDQSAGTSGSTAHSGSRSKLTIVSSTGIFTRWIRWCHCAKSADQYVQLLLRAKLFPASFKNPKTAFTFEVLDHFRLDALECHTAAMNFMSKIGRITDEVFPSRVPVSGPMHRILFPLIS